MKSDLSNKNLNKIDADLQSIIDFESDDDKLQFEAEMLHLNTMDLIAQLMNEHNMNKKKLAKKLSTSQSYITQLFTGDKLINYKLLAKLQRVFNVNFTIDAKNCYGHQFENMIGENIGCKVIDINEYRKNKNFKEYHIESITESATVN